MKKLTLLFALLIAVISVNPQTITQTKIDSAKAYKEMPVLKVRTYRKAGNITYKLVDGKFQKLNKSVDEDVLFKLYFPAYIYTKEAPELSYKMASTSPTITDSTIFVNFIDLTYYISPNQASLVRSWRYKYFELYKQKAGN